MADAHQAFLHQHHPGGLHRNIRTCADGHTHIRSHKRRGIVDAVAHHQHLLALALKVFDLVCLIGGKHIRDDMIDAGSFGNGGCRLFVIAGQHHHRQAQLFHGCHRIRSVRFQHI